VKFTHYLKIGLQRFAAAVSAESLAISVGNKALHGVNRRIGRCEIQGAHSARAAIDAELHSPSASYVKNYSCATLSDATRNSTGFYRKTNLGTFRGE
jgi:hypothetical protein